MFRSKLRKWLPDPDSIRASKWLRWCAPILGHPRLWHLNRRGVALGVAIGMVTGMIPGPVQMLVAGIIAVPLRANIPAAMFATLYTNPFTFVPLYLLAYNIGRLVTGESSAMTSLPRDFEWSWASMHHYIPEVLRWIASLGDTLVIGLAIQLTLFAILGYVVTLVVWRCAVSWAWRRRARLRAERAAS